MRLTSLAAIAMPALLLTACAADEVETLRTSNLDGPAFHNKLAADYKGFSLFEYDRMFDTVDADHFGKKALWAAEGRDVPPDRPEDRNIKDPQRLAELQTARARLMNAFANGAATATPAPAARAQVSYDCWAEQQEEGWQETHIQACRTGFIKAMQMVEAGVGEKPVARAEPVEPARPTAPRDYRVFFDWDSADVTAGAAEILRQAAENAREARLTVIRIVGHADRSGPADYNRGLSKRRADAVARHLARNGIPTDDVAVFGQGESEPLVETGDGVREPQNRRVRVIMGSPTEVGA